MSRYSLNPDRLFDRPWRPGHPFRPKTGRFRRLFMLVALVAMCLLIWAYGFLTDPHRVKGMAERYLSDLTGGRVTVASASLSVFEGLRLDGVRVYAEDAAADGTEPANGAVATVDAPDALVFSARTFVVRYEPRSIVEGQLRATKIIAEKPQVHLSRDVRTGSWNFQRLGRRRPPPPTPSAPPPPAGPAALPELLLRNARVEISEMRDGRHVTLGHASIDGQLTPEMTDERVGHDRYRFSLQSRGLSDDLGPLTTGVVHLGTGRVIAEMRDFEFGRDVRAMLPAEVRQWWERHELAGRIDVPVFDYAPARGPKPAAFTIRTVLNGVALTVPPEEWMTGAEVARRDRARQAAGAMVGLYAAAGMGRGGGVVEWRGGLVAGGEAERARVASADARPISTFPPTIPVALAPAGSTSLAATPPPRHPATPPPSFRTPASPLADLFIPAPVELRQVSGAFEFTESGVKVDRLTARVENNLIEIDGRLGGYAPESPMEVHVRSGRAEDLVIPAAPRYVWSLPRDVRELYEKLRPEGTCRVGLAVRRAEPGGPVDASGFIELVDAQFVVDEFPYPFRHTSGRAELARDGQGRAWLVLKGIRGQGNGANASRPVEVAGWVGPIGPGGGPEPGGLIRITATDLVSDPPLLAALPPDVADALKTFDAPGKGEFPRFRGDVVCEIYKDIGYHGNFKVRLDLDVKEADARLVGFAYPLRKASGKVRIREGYCELVGVKLPHPSATVAAEGRIAWPLKGDDHETAERGRRTDVTVTVRDLPVDDDLLSALPKDRSDWIRSIGLAGRLDVDGRLLGRPVEDGSVAAAAAAAAAARGGDDDSLDYDLGVRLKHGTVRPGGGKFAVDDLTGRLRFTPRRLDLLELAGTRAGAKLSAVGALEFKGSNPRMALVASGAALPLDRDLYDILPAAAQGAWDEVRPVGTVDAEVTFAAPLDARGEPVLPNRNEERRGGAVVVDLAAPAGPQATQPTAIVLDLPASGDRPAVRREVPVGLHGTLRPRDLAASIRTMPYALERMAGEVAISPDKVELRGITGRHGKAELTVSGTGTLSDRASWELKIGARNLPADDALKAALPPSIAALIDTVKLRGDLGLEIDRFSYRAAPDVPPGAPPGTKPGEPEIDLAGRVLFAGASMDVGVPLEKVTGTVRLTTVAVRGGRLDSLTGRVELDSLDLSGREVTKLAADVVKPAGRAEFGLVNLRAGVGGGDLAGQVLVLTPDEGPGRYGVTLTLRNADVRQLAKEKGEGIAGLVTASLALEGTFGKAASRRGRGDVVVTGKELYRIPVLLGLLQVTNLSLPISSPFNTGTARYSLDGERLTFERIELRSANMLMTGEGTLDFGNKQVRMTFVTDNPGAFKIPFVQDLWRGAQQELLRIHVRGTVQDPKVEARSFGTITTTIDEVLKGDAPKPVKKGK